jgi:hypothetical protein
MSHLPAAKQKSKLQKGYIWNQFPNDDVISLELPKAAKKITKSLL